MSKRPLPGPIASQSADETAASWAWRRRRAPLRASEQSEFGAWVEVDPAHAKALARAEAAYERVGDMASAPEIMALRREALALEKKPIDFKPWALAAAACLALAVLSLMRFESLAPVRPVAEVAERNEARLMQPRDHYVTAVGERLTATLSDGSMLTLNTASEARIRYSAAARRIELVRGQAFFTVARDADWPFLVEAGGQTVRALGTEFEVRLEGARVEVVLVEGRVAVGSSAALERGDLRRAVELQAGERVIAARDTPATYEVAPVDTDRITSWRSGRVMFGSTSLRDAVAEINRYRTHPLVIEDPGVAAMEISGAFRTADAQSFGAALGESLPVEERALPDGRTLLAMRDGARP